MKQATRVGITLIALTALLVGCGGGGRGDTAGSGTAGGGSSTPAPTGPSTVYGTQMGGARQGITLSLTGAVTTYAGPTNSACQANGGGTCPLGVTDGTGNNARFDGPWGITTDGLNLFVTDNTSNVIRKIVISSGQVTTLAGTPNVLGGFHDGSGAAAQFNQPTGITTDGVSLYVTDSMNHSIRKIIIATGQVTTIAGPDPAACAAASGGICPSGTADGVGAAARFNKPAGITTDGTYLYVADLANNTIRQVVIATGQVTTLAGTTGLAFGGYVDGIGMAAQFFKPYGLTTDGTYLYVADTGNHLVRRIVLATAQVTTLAGSPGLFGTTDGTGSAARFNNPSYLTTDGNSLYISNDAGYTLRKLDIATNQVSTLAGLATAPGYSDGTGSAARFASPFGMGITTDGVSLYVADTGNQTIRNIR